MAVKYVKDFEFPSSAGFHKGPMKKADGGGVTGPYDINNMEQPPSDAGRGAMYGGPLGAVSDREKMMMKARQIAARRAAMQQQQGTVSDADARMMDQGGSQTPYKKGGRVKSRYAEGGMKAEQGVALPDMSPEKEMFEVYDRQSGDVVGTYGSLKQASRAVDRRDNEYGGYRYGHRPVAKAKGGAVHDDAAQDKAMIKSMVKPGALKKAMGGYADGGGVKPRGLFDNSRQTAPSVASTVYKAKGGTVKKADGGMAGQMPPGALAALASKVAQSRGPQPPMGRSVPVAPRAPMIPQQEAPAGGPQMGSGPQRIGVGQSRPNGPNVGAIRAAMARRASQAMPENAPSMMKKGGKVKGC